LGRVGDSRVTRPWLEGEAGENPVAVA
jgi:hypothetical protein